MALPTQGNINFYACTQSNFEKNYSSIQDGNIIFVPQDASVRTGHIYVGKNLAANIGFENFTWSTTGSGGFITSISPALVESSAGLTLALTGVLGDPAAQKEGKIVLANASNGSANNATTNASTWINYFEDTTKKASIQITGTNPNIQVTGASGKLTIAHTTPGTGSALTLTADGSTTASTTSQTISYISEISKDANGHITSAKKKDLTIALPSFTDAVSKNVVNNVANGSTNDTVTTNASTYLHHYQGSTKRSTHQLSGSNGITVARSTATGAITFSHSNTGLAKSSGLYKIMTDAQGHVSAAANVVVTDLPGFHNGDIFPTSTTTFPSDKTVYDAIQSQLTSAVKFKGGVNAATGKVTDKRTVTDENTSGDMTLTSIAEVVGDMYVVTTAGTFADNALEVGDVIYFQKPVAAGTAPTATDVVLVSGENQYEIPSTVPTISASNTTLFTVEGNTVCAKIAPNYGKISLENSATSVSDLTTNTTTLVAASAQDTFKLKAANKWIRLAGTNAASNKDVLQIAHAMGDSITDIAPVDEVQLEWGDTFITNYYYADEAGHLNRREPHVYVLPNAPEEVMNWSSIGVLPHVSKTTDEISVSNSMVTLKPSNDVDDLKIETVNKWIHAKGDNNIAGAQYIKFSHGLSDVSAGTFGGTSTETAIIVPSITVDEAGHVISPTSVTTINPHATVAIHAFTAKSAATSGTFQLNITDHSNIPSTVNFMPSAGIKLAATASTLTIAHNNSITAQTTESLRTFKYDAQGHITGSTVKSAATFTIQANGTNVVTHTDLGTAQILNFQVDAVTGGLKVGTQVVEVGPVWNVLS